MGRSLDVVGDGGVSISGGGGVRVADGGFEVSTASQTTEPAGAMGERLIAEVRGTHQLVGDDVVMHLVFGWPGR